MVLIGPLGMLTSALSMRPAQSAVVRIAMRSATIGISVSRLATRAALVANRASSASSGRPMAAAKRANWRSLPTATMMAPSAVAKS